MEALFATLADRHLPVREATAQALSKLGQGDLAEAVLLAMGGTAEDWPCVLEMFQDQAKHIVVTLIARLQKTPWYSGERVAVAEALGQIGDPRAIEPLMAELNSTSHVPVREATAAALGEIGDARPVEQLIEIVEDHLADDRVQLAAAEALDKIGDPRAAKALIPLLEEVGTGEREFREAARLALGKFGAAAFAPLPKALGEAVGARDPGIASRAERFYSWITDRCLTIISLLQRALAEWPALSEVDHSAIRQALVDALPRWKEGLRLWSGVPREVKRPLRELVRAAQKILA